jgi:hypothetical protein
MLDNYKRKFFLKYEIKKVLLNSLIKNTFLPRSYRYLALYGRSKLPRISAIVQQKDKCVKTGRV